MSTFLTVVVALMMIAFLALAVAAVGVQVLRSIREFRIGYNEVDDYRLSRVAYTRRFPRR